MLPEVAECPEGAPSGANRSDMYYLYILKSLNNKSFYTGVTKDLEQRLENHNKGGTRSTKPFRPWKIVYVEKFNSKKGALKREFYLKSPKGYLEKKGILSTLI